MVEAMDIKRDFQKTEIGEYPTDWNIKELSVILKSTQLGGNYPNSVLNAEYVLIKMGNLGREFIDLKKIFYIKSETIPQQIDKSNYGDILFNTRNTLDLVGKVAIWKDELPLAFFNSNIMRLVFKDEEISSNFFMNYILNTPKSLHQLRGIATGTTSVAAIYTRDLIKIKVPVPTKTEQTAIATALNDADALITQLEKLIAKKRAIKQGAMQELLKPKNGWKVFDFKNIFRKLNAKRQQIQTKEYQQSGKYPVIDQGKQKVVAYSDNSSKVFSCPNDGLIVFGDHTREIKFVDYDFIVGADGTQLITVNKEHFIKFFFYQLLLKEVPNTGYNRHFKFLLEMEFIIPDKIEQTRIAQILSDMDAEIEALEKKLKKHKMIKQGMMQNLLTGRIRLVWVRK